ncbi:MAG: hypothetical protein EXQ52_09485 [Bryobacterales bacterium]|nr:hypothetical protein [Bryobacterales bacterium]
MRNAFTAANGILPKSCYVTGRYGADLERLLCIGNWALIRLEKPYELRLPNGMGKRQATKTIG